MRNGGLAEERATNSATKMWRKALRELPPRAYIDLSPIRSLCSLSEITHLLGLIGGDKPIDCLIDISVEELVELIHSQSPIPNPHPHSY